MSSTHVQASAPAPQAPSPSLGRVFRFPLIVLAIFGGLFAVPWICIALAFEPGWTMMPFFMTQWHGPLLAVVLIAIWWLFFSAFGWLARLGVAALAAILVAGFIVSVREVELTMGRVALVPRFHFVWEPTAADELDEYLARQPKTDEPLPALDARVGPEDFPRYRGVNFDGQIMHIQLETDWVKQPPKEMWRHPCPGGYGGIAVAGNIVVTLEQRGAGETVACYDRNTGRPRWAYSYDAYYKDKTKMGNGPRSTPTIHDGHIYTIGATGELVCLSADGTKRWSTNILKDAKAKNVMWGLTGSPLIVDDLVIAHAGVDDDAPVDSALIAYEQTTGSIRWRTGNRKAGYSSPQLAILHSVPQIVLFDGAALAGYDPKTGKELWSFPWDTDYAMNSIQPLVLGPDRLFISSETANGCSMLRISAPTGDKSAWSVETAWHNKNLGARYANPVTDGKHIFGLHALQGILVCLDAQTGELKWKAEREGPGQLLLANGILLVVNGKYGDVALFDTDGRELARHVTFANKRDKTWNTPALAGDQLFVRNQAEIVCLKLPRR